MTDTVYNFLSKRSILRMPVFEVDSNSKTNSAVFMLSPLCFINVCDHETMFIIHEFDDLSMFG